MQYPLFVNSTRPIVATYDLILIRRSWYKVLALENQGCCMKHQNSYSPFPQIYATLRIQVSGQLPSLSTSNTHLFWTSVEALAYPHPDESIRRLIIGTDYVPRYCSYFANLFQIVTERAQSLIQSSEIISYEELVVRWYHHLDENRGKNRRSLYREVEAKQPSVNE